MTNFVKEFNALAQDLHQNARDKGFWDNPRNDSEMIMLAVTELAEAVEGLRHGNPPSDHIPEFTAVEEEFADAIIRLAEQAAGRGWRVGEAIEAKRAFNRTRPIRHGKHF